MTELDVEALKRNYPICDQADAIAVKARAVQVVIDDWLVIIAALEDRDRLRTPLGKLLAEIKNLESNARIRDGSGYGIASVSAVVDVLRASDAVRAALEGRDG